MIVICKFFLRGINKGMSYLIKVDRSVIAAEPPLRRPDVEKQWRMSGIFRFCNWILGNPCAGDDELSLAGQVGIAGACLEKDVVGGSGPGLFHASMLA